MNVPTRQCLRKSKRDKTEPSLQERKVSARQQSNGSFAEENRGGISSKKKRKKKEKKREKKTEKKDSQKKKIHRSSEKFKKVIKVKRVKKSF